MDKLKWFLNLYIICNQTKQTIWLSQKAYMTKICNNFANKPTGQLPTTPIDTVELLSLLDKKEVSDTSKIFYQQKVGSLLFAAIATKPNIAFVVSRLSRFNQRQRKIYYEGTNQVFYYFLGTQDYCICYGEETQDISSFLYTSDTLFADNLSDRKSIQGYIMKLFRGVVA